ncbi:MAG TPA: ATP-binding protein [Thermoanaerobaculia bacterium]|nr:ATP-binding protein [Thermoanaerobaculia bacterium]
MKASPAMTVRPQLVHRATLDALVDLSPDPLWVIDASGSVIASNSAFQRWSGAGPQLAELQRRALAGRSIMANVRLIVGGVERTYAVHARPVESGGVAFTAREVLHDGDGSERALELALMHLFASNDPLPELLAKTLEFLCVSDRWDAAALWRIDGQALHANVTWFASASLHEKLAARFAHLTFASGEGTPGRAWASREVIWIADMLEESSIGRSELAAAAGLHSVVATPLLDADRVTGVLELFTHSIRPINEPTRRMLARTGSALARLIERRQLLDQIATKGAEWLLTVDSIRMPIMLVTPDARVTRLNRTAQQLTGRAYDDVVGQPLISLGDHEPWRTLRDIAIAVHDAGMTCTAQIVAGDTSWDVTAGPLAAAGGDDRIVIAMRDTTEVVRLQESVRRGEQLAALGELVAGVAHEVKNPLFGMSVTLDLLDEYLAERRRPAPADAAASGAPPPADVTEALELTTALRTWIARLQSLTESLLAYGRTWSTEMKPADVNEVLAQAIAASQALARDAGVTVDAKLEPGPAIVLMDASRLAMVFENVLANAVQHSRRGDRIEVKSQLADGGIDIAVCDQGPGFNLDELTRVFQPFYTRRRGGTGLGLSIVQRIVDEHGGTVSASNAAQGGAVVHVRLPTYRRTL